MLLANTNPFLHKGRPIENPDSFFGRKRELQEIYRYIRAGQSVSIIGSRRIGKTSLLKYLCHPTIRDTYNLGKDYLFVLIDCQELAGTVSIANLYQRLLDGVREEFSKAEPDLYDFTTWNTKSHRSQDSILSSVTRFLNPRTNNSDKLSHPTNPYTLFRKQLELIAQYKIIFVFDEFEVLASHNQLDASFFTQLRNLAEKDEIIFVTASNISLFDLSFKDQSTLSSPFFNIFSSLRLGLMIKEEVTELIMTLLATTTIRFQDEDMHLLKELAGYHPYLNQIAAYHLFQGKSNSNGSTTRDINFARQQFDGDEDVRNFYHYLWQNLSFAEQQVLQVIIQKDIRQLITLEQQKSLHRKSILIQSKIFADSFSNFIKGLSANHELELPKIQKPNNVHMKLLIEGNEQPAHRPILRQILRDEKVDKVVLEKLSGGYSNYGIYRIFLRRTTQHGFLLERVLKFAPASDVRAEQENYQEYIAHMLKIGLRGEIKAWYPQDINIDEMEKSELRREMGASMYPYAKHTGDDVQNLHQIFSQWIASENINGQLNRLKSDPVRRTLERLFSALEDWQTRTELNQRLASLTEEYERLNRKLNQIAEAAVSHIPMLNLDTRLKEDPRRFVYSDAFIWQNQKYCNPLRWVSILFTLPLKFRWLDQVVRRYMPGLVHGDLNFRNVLVEMEKQKPIDSLWLIDFADTHIGHPLRDFSNLEADLKFVLTNVTESDFQYQGHRMSPILALENQFLQPNSRRQLSLRSKPFPTECEKNTTLRAVWLYTKRIRAEVEKNYIVGTDLRPYYLGLLHATLPVVYYDQLSEWQRLYAFLSAAMICEKIDDLTEAAGQERVLPKPNK